MDILCIISLGTEIVKCKDRVAPCRYALNHACVCIFKAMHGGVSAGDRRMEVSA